MKKKCGPQHPFDKWIAVRGKIAEAAVESKALIIAIEDFIKTVLPDITLTPQLATPKRESVEYGTQTTPPPLHGLYHFPQPLLYVTKYMKQRLVLLVQDLFVLPHLQLSPMMMTIMMMEEIGQLAKAM
jgi:hypothetical protein